MPAHCPGAAAVVKTTAQHLYIPVFRTDIAIEKIASGVASHPRALGGYSNLKRSVGSADAALFVDMRVVTRRDGVIAVKLTVLTQFLLCAHPLV